MTTHCQPATLLNFPPGRIRAVVADDESTRRPEVIAALHASSLFELIAETHTEEECHAAIRNHAPELALCSAALLPKLTAADEVFPLFVVLGGGVELSGRVVGMVANGTRAAQLQDTLAMVAARILTAKAGELSSLIRKYLEHSDELPARVRTIPVQHEGGLRHVQVNEISCIRAAGNNVILHTEAGAFEIREPISRVQEKLESCGFVRVHRGAIVNPDMVRSRVLQNGVVAGLRLADDTFVPVGPNYRDQAPAGSLKPNPAGL